MADITNKRINIYIDQQAAETALQKLQLQADGLTKKITAGQAAGKSMVAELKKLDGVNDSIKKVQDQLDNGLKPSLAQQTSLVSQLRNELKRLSESDPSFAAKLKNYQSQNAELQRMQGNIGLVSKETSNWGNSFEHVLTRIAEYASIYFVFNKVKEFLSSSVEEANKAEEATARLKNILENLGRLDAFDRLKNKAEELSKQFQFLNHNDLIEVEQKLITYGKLTEAQINELLPLIINFAAKQKISITEASEEIQKGLEGTSRVLKNQYGVSMKEGSDVTERMSILMKELAPRVEGAAQAFGDTMVGKAEAAQEKLKEVEEEVGNKLIPALTKLYQWASDAITGLSKFADILKASFETGSFLTGSAIVRAQAIAAQQEEANNSAAASILLRVADKSVDEKKAYLIQLNTKVLEYEGKLLIAKNNHDAATVKNLEQTIGAWQKARDMLDADVTSSTDKRVLGFGDPNYDPKAQKKYEELLKAAEEFNKKLRDLQNESANANKTADQKEIDNIKHKYDEVLIAYEELQKKLKGSGIHLALTIDQIKGLEDAEIVATIRKQMRALFDASQKEFDAAQGKQYADALAQSDKHFSELKAAQAQQFIAGTIDYKEYQDNITAIDEQSNAQKIAIAIQYTAFSNKAAEEVTKFQKTQLDQQTKDAIEAYQKQLANEKSVADLVKQTALKDAQTKVDISLKGSSDEYLAKKNYLDIERQQQLKALEQQRQDDLEKVKDDENRAGERIKINDSINTQIADTNAKFDAQQKDLHAQHIKGIIDAIAGYASQAVNILGTFVDARNTAEQSALQKELNNNEKRKQSLQKLLNGKFIDESKYAKEIAAIDADSEKKKQVAAQKEFERTKKVQLAQALINGAMGVTAVLAAKPGATDILSLAAFRAVNVAITLATTAAQIATISAQKPKFAKGGALTGPSHSQGGMPVINPTTGAKEAEVEGGEYIISKNTVRNNKGLADALLFTSLYRNGAPVNRNYVPVDYAGITKTYNHLRFALGGIMPAANPVAGKSSGEDLSIVLNAILQSLNTPAQPIIIQNDISLKQIDDANAQRTRIIQNANFKG